MKKTIAIFCAMFMLTTMCFAGDGDVNSDNQLDVVDIVIIRNHIVNKTVLTDAQMEAADIDGNGNIDIIDVVQMRAKVVMGTDYHVEIVDFSSEVLRLVNVERAKAGLESLKTDERLTMTAQIRAQEISTFFSHTRPDGSSCFTAYTQTGLNNITAGGENISGGHATPESVVKALMNSEGHRDNILSSVYTYVGIGVYYDENTEYKYYCSQDFATFK